MIILFLIFCLFIAFVNIAHRRWLLQSHKERKKVPTKCWQKVLCQVYLETKKLRDQVEKSCCVQEFNIPHLFISQATKTNGLVINAIYCFSSINIGYFFNWFAFLQRYFPDHPKTKTPLSEQTTVASLGATKLNKSKYGHNWNCLEKSLEIYSIKCIFTSVFKWNI